MTVTSLLSESLEMYGNAITRVPMFYLAKACFKRDEDLDLDAIYITIHCKIEK